MPGLVVQKYGGTSVGDLEKIRQVAARTVKFRDEGNRVVVVVSAMAGETDRLLQLGCSLGAAEPTARELDLLLSTGEQMCAALLAIALADRGVPSVALTGPQVPIRTTSTHGQARIESVSPAHIRRHLSEGRVVVVAGFQGISENGDITTLGRGGSDLTAVALAAALEADFCEICTDVSGVYTADPQICPDARPIRELTYDEMLELASLGAKVLQARSVQLAKRYLIPVRVRSTFESHPGTLIHPEGKTMEGTVVSAVTCDRNEGKISLRGLPDPLRSTAQLFAALAEAHVIASMIVQDRAQDGRIHLTFTVPRGEFESALTVAKKIARSDSRVEVVSQDRVAKVSAVGLGLRTDSGVAARLFGTLAKEGIEVMAVSTSDIKISCLIDERHAERAVRSLHEAFGLAKEPN